MANIGDFTLRDFRRGRISKSAVSGALVPENSVAETQNLNYEEVLGSAKVRAGTTRLGAVISPGGSTPLGLTTYSTQDLNTNIVVGVVAGGSNSFVYYTTFWTTASTQPNSGTWSQTKKNRFANLGGRIFVVNGVQAMHSTTNGNVWGTTNCLGTSTQHIVGLVFRQKNRLLAAGDTVFPSRVWFSGIINPGAGNTITWAEGNQQGDYIDINPDDGDYVTAFAETASQTLVFKSNAFYRLNVVSKTVDTENIFDVGAVSQEAVTRCQGVVYFFSGKDIRRTSGGFPEQISRLGVQDFIDAIPQSSWANVGAGADDWNVYFSIGNVTLNNKQNKQVTYKNVVLKFSTRDESWSIHAYGDTFRFFTKYTTSADGKTLIGSTTSGDVQTLNKGQTDNGKPIFYFLETQDLEFGAIQNVKQVTKNFVTIGDNLQNSRIKMSADGKDFKDVPIQLEGRVNVGRNININGREHNVRWEGESTGNPPILEGFVIPELQTDGLN